MQQPFLDLIPPPEMSECHFSRGKPHLSTAEFSRFLLQSVSCSISFFIMAGKTMYTAADCFTIGRPR